MARGHDTAQRDPKRQIEDDDLHWSVNPSAVRSAYEKALGLGIELQMPNREEVGCKEVDPYNSGIGSPVDLMKSLQQRCPEAFAWVEVTAPARRCSCWSLSPRGAVVLIETPHSHAISNRERTTRIKMSRLYTWM